MARRPVLYRSIYLVFFIFLMAPMLFNFSSWPCNLETILEFGISFNLVMFYMIYVEISHIQRFIILSLWFIWAMNLFNMMAFTLWPSYRIEIVILDVVFTNILSWSCCILVFWIDFGISLKCKLNYVNRLVLFLGLLGGFLPAILIGSKNDDTFLVVGGPLPLICVLRVPNCIFVDVFNSLDLTIKIIDWFIRLGNHYAVVISPPDCALVQRPFISRFQSDKARQLRVRIIPSVTLLACPLCSFCGALPCSCWLLFRILSRSSRTVYLTEYPKVLMEVLLTPCIINLSSLYVSLSYQIGTTWARICASSATFR